MATFWQHEAGKNLRIYVDKARYGVEITANKRVITKIQLILWMMEKIF